MTAPPAWPADIEGAIPAYLGNQRWFSGDGAPVAESVRVERVTELWEGGDGDHRLWQAIVGAGDDTYQLLLGQRPGGEPADFLQGHENAVVGAVGSWYFYDATLDADLSLRLLQVVSDGSEEASRVRPMNGEQSNTSLVFDDRMIFKVFRRLRSGANPDVEVTTALASSDFDHVATPLLRWHDGEYDFGFGQQYLAGGSDGWALALTSLRDLYNTPAALPSEAGGDFAAEAERLGRVTADMHVALGRVFPIAESEATRDAWDTLVAGFEERLAAAGRFAGTDLVGPSRAFLERIGTVRDPGPAIRVHGDFHLGQCMRTDSGWFVLDFEGEPAKSVEERARPTSALKDVTSMLRSFHYASRHAIIERALPDWADLEPLARAWEIHNRQAFLDGYQAHPRIHELLPDPAAAQVVMMAYELDKALYELDYERSMRPDWVSIPIDALDRIVNGQIGGGHDG